MTRDELDEIDIDKIIDANMTVTDHLLRDAIRGVVVAAVGEAVAAEREACASEQEKYRQLLMAVSRKFPNETRHETALRYIVEAESKADNTAKTAAIRARGKA